ncbi:MAG TPA: ACP S-malonyltransferase [Gammaproteobacteria bacterium]|nr:ACP S-malonyltransferase [Gammaproteobacteria bacterium]
MNFAAIFPGQGSQSVGMMAELAESHEVVKRTLDEASGALGFDLAAMMRDGPAEALNLTQNTQPALLAAGVAAWRAWEASGGPEPVACAGHSLGEYTALVVAGALDFHAALRLVHLRGQAMQEAVPAGTGAMAAILGLDAATVTRVCAEASSVGPVSPANLNTPEQTVIAGEKAAVDEASRLAEEAGAKRVVALAVSAPSHCALMAPAAERLATALTGIELHTPRIPVINNADVEAPREPSAIRDALVRQLTQPVRWVEVVGALKDKHDAGGLAEFGPGRVLSGMMRRIDRELKCWPVYDASSLDAALAALK